MKKLILAFSTLTLIFSLIFVMKICLLRKYIKEGKVMTKMQVEWQNADENVRHNRAVEEETIRHNVASEQLSADVNSIRRAELDETRRSHQVNEGLNATQLNETIRHQQAMDAEAMRHNGATEQEIKRHNESTEAVDRAANSVKLLCTQLSAAATRDAATTKAEGTKYVADTNKTIAEMKIASDQLISHLDRLLKQKQVDSSILKDKAYIRDLERRYFLDYDKFMAQQQQIEREYNRNVQNASDNADRSKAIEIFRKLTHDNINNWLNGDGYTTIDLLNDIYDAIHDTVKGGSK